MKSAYLSRREEIILATIELIHTLGIKHVSMKEIAKLVGVTEAALYKHFKSKEEILIGVFEHYERYDEHIFKTLERNDENCKESILVYFQVYSEYYGSYKEITSIAGLHTLLLYEAALEPLVKQTFERKQEFITQLIQNGQAKGDIKQSIAAEHAALILFGTFERIIATWRMQNFGFSLKDKTMAVIEELLALYEV